MATEWKEASTMLAKLMPDGVHTISRLGSRGAPRKRIARALSSGLGRGQVQRHAARLAGALPTVIVASPRMRLWRSALIGPATYPKGYRDAVVLSKGLLIGLKVRQAGSGGHLHADPTKEVSRALAAYRARCGSHRDRTLRPLIPSMQMNFAWLRMAAGRHDVPINASLGAALLETVNASGESAKAKFRATLDGEVAELLPDDLSLERFHNWMADGALPRPVMARRRKAFRAVAAGCEHIRSRDEFASRLDAGDDAPLLLGEILEADPAAVTKLAKIQREALASLEEAQRKAWALELMPDEIHAELGGDLDLAGGWAGRAMSFAAAATDVPSLCRDVARHLLSRPGLRRFGEYSATFADWPYQEGRVEFSELLAAVVRFGLLPDVMIEAIESRRSTPTSEKIDAAIREVGCVAAWTSGVMTVELARLQWRKVRILPEMLVAICHPNREEWPRLIGRREGAHAIVDCIGTEKELEGETPALVKFPALMHDILVLGHHLMRLRDMAGKTVALTVVKHEELEAANKMNGVVPEQIERDGWSATAQWKRGMRVEIGRVIHAVSRRSRHLKGLRARIEQRRAVASALKAMPCGFDHTNVGAWHFAAVTMAGVMKLLVRDRKGATVRLFGPPKDASLEADAAFLADRPPPSPPAAPATLEASAIRTLSPVFRILSEEPVGVPAEYEPSAANGKIRTHSIGQKPVVPLDPLKARYIVIDTETTGLDKSDRIIEIAAVEMIGPKPTGRTFHRLINPGRPIPDGAFRVHGINDDMVRGMPKFPDVCKELIAFFRGSKWWLVAHSAEFDLGFINRELKRACADYSISANRTICTMRLSTACVGGGSLDEACDRLGIDRSQRAKHRAMLDAELCASVFSFLIFGRDAPSAPGVPSSPPPAAEAQELSNPIS